MKSVRTLKIRISSLKHRSWASKLAGEPQKRCHWWPYSARAGRSTTLWNLPGDCRAFCVFRKGSAKSRFELPDDECFPPPWAPPPWAWAASHLQPLGGRLYNLDRWPTIQPRSMPKSILPTLLQPNQDQSHPFVTFLLLQGRPQRRWNRAIRWSSMNLLYSKMRAMGYLKVL